MPPKTKPLARFGTLQPIGGAKVGQIQPKTVNNTLEMVGQKTNI